MPLPLPPAENLPIVVIACQVFQHLLEVRLPSRADPHRHLPGLRPARVPRNLTDSCRSRSTPWTSRAWWCWATGCAATGCTGSRPGRTPCWCRAPMTASPSCWVRTRLTSESSTIYARNVLPEQRLAGIGQQPAEANTRNTWKSTARNRRIWLMDTAVPPLQAAGAGGAPAGRPGKIPPAGQRVAEYCAQWGVQLRGNPGLG